MIVSLTAYDRPEYLTETLYALQQARKHIAEGVILVARVEPSPVAEDVRDLIEGWRVHPRGTYVTINERRLGLQHNTFEALSDAWAVAERMKEDFVLHLEDDFVLSPDALAMHAWMRDTYRRDANVFFTGSYGCRTADEVKPGWETKVYRGTSFSCRAWGHWRDVWDNELRAEWPHGEGIVKDGLPAEWAWFVNERVMDGRKEQVLPELSRVMHIGIEGEHSTPELHRNGWEGLPLADAIYEAGYYE